jgi:hypothetical protein
VTSIATLASRRRHRRLSGIGATSRELAHRGHGVISSRDRDTAARRRGEL